MVLPGASVFLACPLCGGGFRALSAGVKCPRGHNFDFSRSGYLNLLPVNRKHSREPGDSKEMVAARRSFLEAGYYSRVSDAVNAAVAAALAGMPSGREAVVLDVGCGEGYYLARLSDFLGAGVFLGLDISKPAISEAARNHRRGNILWAVAGAKKLPVGDGKAAVIVSVFSPRDFGEFHRVLARGGSLVTVTPAENHLISLRRLLYDDVFPMAADEKDRGEFSRYFIKADSICLDYETNVGGKEAVRNLIGMTPYSWKTPREKLAAARELHSLSVEVAVNVTVLSRRD